MTRTCDASMDLTQTKLYCNTNSISNHKHLNNNFVLSDSTVPPPTDFTTPPPNFQTQQMGRMPPQMQSQNRMGLPPQMIQPAPMMGQFQYPPAHGMPPGFGNFQPQFGRGIGAMQMPNQPGAAVWENKPPSYVF